MTDEVNERPVCHNRQFGFGRTGIRKAEGGGRSGNGALLVDGDVRGVDGGAKEGIRADLPTGRANC